MDTVCFKSLERLKVYVRKKLIIKLLIEDQETLIAATQIQVKQSVNWGGKPSLELKKCVLIPGDGRHAIQMDLSKEIKRNEINKRIWSFFEEGYD